MSELFLGRLRTMSWDALEVELLDGELDEPSDFIDLKTGVPTRYLVELGYVTLMNIGDNFDLARLISPLGRGCGRGFSQMLYSPEGSDPNTVLKTLRNDFIKSFHNPKPVGDLSARWNTVHHGLSHLLGLALVCLEINPILDNPRYDAYRARVAYIDMPTRVEFDRFFPPTDLTTHIRSILDASPEADLVDD